MEVFGQLMTPSPNNPCPFLRALVAGGYVADHIESLSAITGRIVRASCERPSKPSVLGLAIYFVAMIANGLSPMRLIRSVRSGAELDAIRGGPLDKRGAGSGILRQDSQVDERELERIDTFATYHTDADGTRERGLDQAQIRAMMDANFARAKGRRRSIDRFLMKGEWPLLLRIIGKTSTAGPYLSVDEIRALFVDRELPSRIIARLTKET